MKWIEAVRQFWNWLKEQMPAIVIGLFTYEEQKISAAEQDKKTAQLNLQEKEAEDAVKKKYIDMSDDDVIRTIADSSGVDASSKKGGSSETH